MIISHIEKCIISLLFNTKQEKLVKINHFLCGLANEIILSSAFIILLKSVCMTFLFHKYFTALGTSQLTQDLLTLIFIAKITCLGDGPHDSDPGKIEVWGKEWKR